MNISLIGPSGSGKGSHTAKLVKEFNLVHVATGDLFRENLEKRTALGILARKYMSEGELVPDEVVEAMIEERLWKISPEQGVLFDGFPRTSYQAKSLDQVFQEMDRALDDVIYLKVSDEAIVQRLSGRLICRECLEPFHKTANPFKTCPHQKCEGQHLYQRPDDTPEMGRARLKVFHRSTGPVIDYYQERGRLIILEGEGDFAQVHAALIAAVEAIQRKEARPATREEVAQLQALRGIAVAIEPGEAVLPSLDIVLLGAPGSGKGTQAEQLARQLQLQHIATGDLFRENLKNKTDLGNLAKAYMDRGELVPDGVTESMVQERLARPDARGGFILDGFPRTLSQAEALSEMLTDMRRRLAGVLYINVADAAIVNRLSGRLICRNCQTPYHLQFKAPKQSGHCDLCGGELYQRDDDNPATVKARLKTFHGQTEPLIHYYREAGTHVEIAGEGKVSDVTDRTIAAARGLQVSAPFVASNI